MDNVSLAAKLKTLRLKNGFSQDELAELARVSLRTVQRMENAEAIPRMDTVKRLFQIFGVRPDEVFDWSDSKDNGYLLGMNLSALAFLIMPIIGVVLPLILWISKKDTIFGVNELGRKLISFQLSFTLVYYLAIALIGWKASFLVSEVVTPSVVLKSAYIRMGILFLIYSIEVGMILWNTYRIHKNLPVKYFPKINFLRL